MSGLASFSIKDAETFLRLLGKSFHQLRGNFHQHRNMVSIPKPPTSETTNIEYHQLRGIPVVFVDHRIEISVLLRSIDGATQFLTL